MDNNTGIVAAENTISSGTQTFTQQEMIAVYNVCSSVDVLASDVVNQLMRVVKMLAERINNNGNNSDLLEDVENALALSRGLKQDAQKNNALKFFYFGVYQAQIEALQKEVKMNQKMAREQDVIDRKHFPEIMQILYSRQICRQIDLARALNMNRSNLSHEMDRLVNVGYVEQQRIGKFKYYSLAPLGVSYYNTYLRISAQFQKRETVAIKRKRDKERIQVEYPNELIGNKQSADSELMDFCYERQSMIRLTCLEENMYMHSNNLKRLARKG